MSGPGFGDRKQHQFLAPNLRKFANSDRMQKVDPRSQRRAPHRRVSIRAVSWLEAVVCFKHGLLPPRCASEGGYTKRLKNTSPGVPDTQLK